MTARERPILFSAPMVRAILAGNKTQTRRVVKLNRHYQIEERDDGSLWPWMYDDDRASDSWLACPYGMPGDRIWVRETWREWSDAAWHYAADLAVLPKLRDRDLAKFLAQRSPFAWSSYKWRPSIFMPRAASRISLEINAVRVQRLQDISVGDAIAEGIQRGGPENPDGIEQRGYKALWESINGPGSWEANSWVWAINFKRLA